MPHILYLAHDVTEPAVRRRVMMLKRGGATVDLAGFARRELAGDVENCVPHVIGRTQDARLFQRSVAVAKAYLTLGRVIGRLRKPDIILARNLEMLVLGSRASKLLGGQVPVIYECLDIHRLLLSRGPAGILMRTIEWMAGRRARAVMTSSPAFLTHYFQPLSRIGAPAFIIENKVMGAAPDASILEREPLCGRPLRIGWFGALRCKKSLEILAEFARMMEGRFEVVLRGRPAYAEIPDFDNIVSRAPFLSYRGPYRNPEDLNQIYRDVDFTWTIDCFEEGLNSKWLLPNRLYEGCYHGAIPIAAMSTQTAAALRERRLGVTLSELSPGSLAAALGDLDAQAIRSLSGAIMACDRRSWAADDGDCRDLVTRLSGFPDLCRPGPRTAVSSQPAIVDLERQNHG